MQPTLISLRGRILAIRVALIVIAALALPGAVRSALGCGRAPAPARVARWKVVAPQRLVRAEVARLACPRAHHDATRAISRIASNGALVLMSLSKYTNTARPPRRQRRIFAAQASNSSSL